MYHITSTDEIKEVISRQKCLQKNQLVWFLVFQFFSISFILTPQFIQWINHKSQLTLSLYLQNSRGGCIVLQDVGKPAKDEWGSPLEAIEAALDLEKEVNQSILDMHGVASTRTDPHLCDFLETHFLTEQVEAIKELADWATKLRGVGSGLGEHIIDGEIGA